MRPATSAGFHHGSEYQPGRHRTAGDAAARVVVRGALRRRRRRLDLAALELDAAVLGDRARRLLTGQRLQLGSGVHAHRGARGAHVVQALQRALLGQQRLLGGGGLIDLRRRGGVALGGVGHRLLGGVVGAGQVEHLAAEALDDAAGVGLGVGQRGGVAPAGRA